TACNGASAFVSFIMCFWHPHPLMQSELPSSSILEWTMFENQVQALHSSAISIFASSDSVAPFEWSNRFACNCQTAHPDFERPEETRHLGKWAMLHCNYLKQYRFQLYT
ncbi:MAG: hypothetical protein RR824_06735, partial [Clostridia bacterium]